MGCYLFSIIQTWVKYECMELPHAHITNKDGSQFNTMTLLPPSLLWEHLIHYYKLVMSLEIQSTPSSLLLWCPSYGLRYILCIWYISSLSFCEPMSCFMHIIRKETNYEIIIVWLDVILTNIYFIKEKSINARIYHLWWFIFIHTFLHVNSTHHITAILSALIYCWYYFKEHLPHFLFMN